MRKCKKITLERLNYSKHENSVFYHGLGSALIIAFTCASENTSF